MVENTFKTCIGLCVFKVNSKYKTNLSGELYIYIYIIIHIYIYRKPVTSRSIPLETSGVDL